MVRRLVAGPEELRKGADLREAYAARLAKNNYINREVRAMDCVADDSGTLHPTLDPKQIRRFDSAHCKVRVDVPCFLPGQMRKRECLEQVPRDFYVGTIFMDAKPRRIEFPEPRA